METCFDEIRLWMSQNHLKLNDDKTECIIIGGGGLGGLEPPPQEGPQKKDKKKKEIRRERGGGGEEKSCKDVFSSPFHLMPLEFFSSFCQNYFIMMSHEISL